jgi:hypothetical protein
VTNSIIGLKSRPSRTVRGPVPAGQAALDRGPGDAGRGQHAPLGQAGEGAERQGGQELPHLAARPPGGLECLLARWEPATMRSKVCSRGGAVHEVEVKFRVHDLAELCPALSAGHRARPARPPGRPGVRPERLELRR